jgi:hypothetical protein
LAGIKAPPVGEETAPLKKTLPIEENRTGHSPLSLAGADIHSAPVLRMQLDPATASGPRVVAVLTDLHRGRGVRMKTRPKRMTSVVPTSERVVS